MSKKKKYSINLYSYIFSIFKKDKKIKMTDKYNKFMINRIIASSGNYKCIEIIEELNKQKYSNLSNEEHYDILYTKVPKGFYKIDKENVFKQNYLKNKRNKYLLEITQNDWLKLEDFNFYMKIISKKERNKINNYIDELIKQDSN